MAESSPVTESDDVEDGEGTESTEPLSVADLGSEMNRRHLLTALGSAGTLATAGCLGLLGDRSETGPRPGSPTAGMRVRLIFSSSPQMYPRGLLS